MCVYPCLVKEPAVSRAISRQQSLSTVPGKAFSIFKEVTNQPAHSYYKGTTFFFFFFNHFGSLSSPGQSLQPVVPRHPLLYTASLSKVVSVLVAAPVWHRKGAEGSRWASPGAWSCLLPGSLSSVWKATCLCVCRGHFGPHTFPWAQAEASAALLRSSSSVLPSLCSAVWCSVCSL